MPAAVQVEALAEQVEAHHDALAVPARAGPSPHGDGHDGSPGLASFHSTKSAGWRLLLGAEDLALAAAGEHVVERLVGEQAVVLAPSRRQVHAVVGGVGAADLDELADHRDHLVDVLGGVRHVVGPGDAEARPWASNQTASHLRGDVLPRAALGVGPVDDLVVDVGDVGDEPDVEPGPAQVAARARRRRRSGGRDRGAAGRRPSGRRGRCSPCPARAWRARGPPAWRCRTGAARGPRIRATGARGALVAGPYPGPMPRSPTSRRSTASRPRWSERWEADGTYRFDRTADARRRVLHRHAAADRVRLDPHGHGVRLHPDRRHRPLPADARQGRVLPDRLGRQRPGHRAPGAELLRRALRPVAARTTRASSRRSAATCPRATTSIPISRPNFVELCHELTAIDEAVFEDLFRRLGLSVRLVAAVHDDQRRQPAHQPAGVPAQPGPRRGLQRRGADGVGRRRPHGRRPGRDRGPRAPGRLPPAGVPRARRRRADRHDPARARRQLRRPRRPPRRRALPAAGRLDGAHAALRRRGAGRRPPARRARQGHRHRHGLHVRRHHRRHVVARAGPADAQRHRPRRPLRRRRRRRGWPTDAGARRRTPQLAGTHGQAGADGDGRAAAGQRRPARRAAADHPPGEVLRARQPPAGDRHQPPVVHPQRRARPGPPRRVPRPRQGARLVPRPHAPPLRALGRGPQRRLADQPAALLRRADPAVVPGRRRRRARPRPPDRAGRGHAADRPVDRRAARLRRRPARPARRLRRRPRHHGHVGDVVADAADRRPLGRRPRPVGAGVPDGHPPAGPRDHPHVAVLDGRALALRARLAAVGQRHAQRLDPRPRPQEDVEVEGQRRHAGRRCSSSTAPTPCATGRSRPGPASTPRSARTR